MRGAGRPSGRACGGRKTAACSAAMFGLPDGREAFLGQAARSTVGRMAFASVMSVAFSMVRRVTEPRSSRC